MSKKNEKPVNKKKKIRTVTARRNRVLAVLISVILALTIFLYFAFNLGLPARMLNGATIAGKGVSVTELNYFYYPGLSEYSQFGLIQTADDLKRVVDLENNQTYQDRIQESATKNWQRILLLERQAKEDGFTSSLAEVLANDEIEIIRESIKTGENRITADQQLERSYGSGMTVRKAKEIMTRQFAADEYMYDLILNKFAVDSSRVQEIYDADPGAFSSISFHMFEVEAVDPNAPVDEVIDTSDATSARTEDETTSETTAYEPTEDDIKIAVEKAQRIVDAASDAVAFRDAAELEAVGVMSASFAAGSDPTPRTGTKSIIEKDYGEDAADFLTDPTRKEGDAKVVETNRGAYALYFVEYVPDVEPTANYRKITMTIGSSANVTSDVLESQLNELMEQVNSEDDFIRLAKEESEETRERFTGGFDVSSDFQIIMGKSRKDFTLTENEDTSGEGGQEEIDTGGVTDVTNPSELDEASEEMTETTTAETSVVASEESKVASAVETKSSEESGETILEEDTEDADYDATRTVEEDDFLDVPEPTEDDRTYEWLFDEDRVAGDMTIIRGDTTVTLYYFLENVETWEAKVKTEKPQTDYNEWFTALTEIPENGYKINKWIWDFVG